MGTRSSEHGSGRFVSAPRELDGRSVLVTGAGGFIGAAAVRRLAVAGAHVTALLGPRGSEVVMPPPGVTSRFGDITDIAALVELVAGADLVVHLAGAPSVAASFDHPAEYARVHVVGTAALLEACRGASVRRMVHISSAELYAQPSRNPVDEDHPIMVSSPYGAAKLGAESMVRVLAPVLQLEAAVLRPFSVFGPGAPLRSLVGSVVRQAITSEAVTVADLRPVRDYCYVDDVADAIVSACHRPLPQPVRIYNIGSGRGVSVADLIRVVLERAARTIPVMSEPHSDRPRSATVTALVASPERAARELGWEATTSLADGITQTLEWARGITTSHA